MSTFEVPVACAAPRLLVSFSKADCDTFFEAMRTYIRYHRTQDDFDAMPYHLMMTLQSTFDHLEMLASQTPFMETSRSAARDLF